MGASYGLVTGFDENFVRPLFRLSNYGNPTFGIVVWGSKVNSKLHYSLADTILAWISRLNVCNRYMHSERERERERERDMTDSIAVALNA